MGMRLLTTRKLNEHVKLHIVPRIFMIFQKSDTVLKREIGRQEVFQEIDFGVQEILEGGTVGDDIIKSAARVLGR